MDAPELRIPIPLNSRSDARGATRFGVGMPVRVEGGDGVTLDMSSSGLRFESDRAYAPGDRMRVTIDYLLDGHDFPLSCEVEVVRCEPAGARFAIGARLLSPIAESPWDAVP